MHDVIPLIYILYLKLKLHAYFIYLDSCQGSYIRNIVCKINRQWFYFKSAILVTDNVSEVFQYCGSDTFKFGDLATQIEEYLFCRIGQGLPFHNVLLIGNDFSLAIKKNYQTTKLKSLPNVQLGMVYIYIYTSKCTCLIVQE